MMGLKLFIAFVAITSGYCALASSVAAKQPLGVPDERCYSDRLLSPCFNNYCVRRYCDEAEPSPDCQFEDTCQDGCICKEGYLISRDDTCVPADQCTNPISCVGDKVFTNCINGGCDRVNCTQLRQPLLCRDLVTGACDPGCVCKDNKLLTEDGCCVAANECPAKEVCPNPHEIFDPCLSNCPSQYCPGLANEPTECSSQPKPGDPGCQPGCRCEEGFYKTLGQDCVPLKDCPPPEYYLLDTSF